MDDLIRPIEMNGYELQQHYNFAQIIILEKVFKDIKKEYDMIEGYCNDYMLQFDKEMEDGIYNGNKLIPIGYCIAAEGLQGAQMNIYYVVSKIEQTIKRLRSELLDESLIVILNEEMEKLNQEEYYSR